MAAQPFRSAVPPLTLDRLEHARHLARVVSGAGHDLCAQQIGLALELATELEEVSAGGELRAFGDHRARAAAENGAEHLPGNRADLELLASRRLHRAVPQDHVRELVRHHAGNLAL